MSQMKPSVRLIKQAKTSKVAAIKLMCMQCAHWETDEIRYCTVTECAMYPFRPFQEEVINVVPRKQ